MQARNRFILAVCAALASTLAVAAPTVLAKQSSQQVGATATASGEVRRVDAAGGKVTIKHGEIPGLELPAMTLVYRAEPALLAGIKPGQKVRFTATRQAKSYVITQIQ